MAPEAVLVAVEAGQSMLATATLMLLTGIAMLGVAIARGVAVHAALREYVRGGAWFVFPLLALAAIAWLWRYATGRSNAPRPELSDEVPIATGRDAWMRAVRSARLNVAFLTVIALVQPSLTPTLAGFSLVGLCLIPLWAYRRLQSSGPTTYIVRGPGRWQQRTFSGRRNDPTS